MPTLTRDSTMSNAEFLQSSFLSFEVNKDFTAATLVMRDQSRLHFRHRVDERWIHALAGEAAPSAPILAGRAVPLISFFRLNSRHLDIHFMDGSRWDVRF